MMGGMAGVDDREQPQRPPWRAVAAPVGRPRPPGDELPVSVLGRHGDPTLREVRLPSQPESAAIARRLAATVALGHWALPPQLADHVVLLVSELVGNAVRHTGARTF